MKNCPDCKGELVMGSVVDATYGGVNAGLFAENDKADSKSISSFRNNFRNLRKVIAYRCTSCNRIFHYAGDDVIKKDLKASAWIWIGVFAFCILFSFFIFVIAQVVISR